MKKFTKILISVMLLALLSLSAISCGNKGDIELPRGMQLASDPELVPYYFFVPNDWIIDEKSGWCASRASEIKTVVATVMSDSKKYDFGESENLPESYWNNYKKSLDETADKIESVSSFKQIGETESITLKKNDTVVAAVRCVYTITLGGTAMKVMQVVGYSDGEYTLITFSAPADTYDDFADDYNSIISEFKFIK